MDARGRAFALAALAASAFIADLPAGRADGGQHAGLHDAGAPPSPDGAAAAIGGTGGDGPEAAPPGVMLHVYPRDGAFHYAPAEVHVQPGAEVVLGHIFATHSLTSPEGLFNATGNATHWPTITAPLQPGRYAFHCWLHADPQTSPEDGMAGVLIVGLAPMPPQAGREAGMAAWPLLALALVLGARRRLPEGPCRRKVVQERGTTPPGETLRPPPGD